jgi:hypothetical protein
MNKHVSDQRKSQNHKQKELRFDFRQVRSAQGIAAAIRWWPGVGNNQLPVGRLRTSDNFSNGKRYAGADKC